jgi:hypothetical protein
MGGKGGLSWYSACIFSNRLYDPQEMLTLHQVARMYFHLWARTV